MRGIKKSGKLKKGLITSLLKSEISNVQCNYMKHFNNVNNTNVNNNTNVDTNDDTYDGKISDKISDIRVILSGLGDVVTKDDRVKIENFMK